MDTKETKKLENLKASLDKDLEKGDNLPDKDLGGEKSPSKVVVPQAKPEQSKFVNIDKHMTEDATRMKEYLWSQPLSTFVVPLYQGEKPGVAEEIVQINGYKLTIKKGVMVKLPMPIIEILADHYAIQMGDGMGQDKRIDRDQAHLDALS